MVVVAVVIGIEVAVGVVVGLSECGTVHALVVVRRCHKNWKWQEIEV